MMLRVRPAQLMTMWVLSLGTRSRMRRASSPLGQLIAVGMFILRNSENGRPSSTTTSSLRSSMAASSVALTRGVW